MMAGPVKVALPLGLTLGEGLHWDAATGWLWFVDIQGRSVLRWRPDGAAAERWVVSERVGWVIPCRSGAPGALLLGLQSGMACGDWGDESGLRWLARPFPGQPALRLNDAKADASGAVWAGSLNQDDESRPDGRLFRLGPDGDLSEHDSGYGVCNGPALHPHGDWMLHTDSARRTIYRFDLDSSAGRISGKRVWKVLAEQEGFPDGMCFDAEGCVWVAHWGGACISRYDADGKLLRRVALPTDHVTNVCFAGERLERLFVTSARQGLDARQLAAQPHAGDLFEVDADGVCGLPGRPYGRAAPGA